MPYVRVARTPQRIDNRTYPIDRKTASEVFAASTKALGIKVGDADIKGQSPRKGAASDAVAANLPASTWKKLFRWSLGVQDFYVELPAETIKKNHILIAETAHQNRLNGIPPPYFEVFTT